MSAPRTVHTLTLLSTGLLAGALGYRAVNLVPTFDAVPLDVRLTDRVRAARHVERSVPCNG